MCTIHAITHTHTKKIFPNELQSKPRNYIFISLKHDIRHAALLLHCQESSPSDLWPPADVELEADSPAHQQILLAAAPCSTWIWAALLSSSKWRRCASLWEGLPLIPLFFLFMPGCLSPSLLLLSHAGQEFGNFQHEVEGEKKKKKKRKNK